MKYLSILLVVASFSFPLALLAKEATGHRENKPQTQNHRSRTSAQDRQQNRFQKPARHRSERSTEQHRSQPQHRRVATNNHRSNDSVNRSGTSTRTQFSKPPRRPAAANNGNRRYRLANNDHSSASRTYRTVPKQHRNSRHQNNDKKYQHRKHTLQNRNHHSSYVNRHYRGHNRYGRWFSGHRHYHYDYRYRSLYNPHQWYDDYYYQAYFDWRLDRSYAEDYGYYSDYSDPYYCPNGFADFITGLTIGALIYNW